MSSRRLNLVVRLLAMGLCLAIASPITGNNPRSTPRTSASVAVPPQLLKVLPALSLDAVPLGDFFEFMEDVGGGLTLVVDWAELKRLGIGPESPVSFKAFDFPWGSALRFVLWEVAGPGRLDYALRGGVVHISTAEMLRATEGAFVIPPGALCPVGINLSDPLIVWRIDERGWCGMPDPLPVPSKGIQIEKVPVDFIVEWLRFESVKNVWANNAALERAGVTPKTVITVKIPGEATVKQTLDAIVSSIPAREPVGYAQIDGVMVISTRSDINRLLGR